MDEQNLLSRLRHGDEQALAAAITQYSASRSGSPAGR